MTSDLLAFENAKEVPASGGGTEVANGQEWTKEEIMNSDPRTGYNAVGSGFSYSAEGDRELGSRSARAESDGGRPATAGGSAGSVAKTDSRLGGGVGQVDRGVPAAGAHVESNPAPAAPARKADPASEKLAEELRQFESVASSLRARVVPAEDFRQRCLQAFDIANELFGHAPTWVCFYRELMGTDGFIRRLFPNDEEFGTFLRSDQYHQVQLMLTALRSRDLPETDPNDPQRMITVRLPKSLHEAMCEEAERLNISVNRLCISRMLQLLDPKMIPKNSSKPRGRKPRRRTGKSVSSTSDAAS